MGQTHVHAWLGELLPLIEKGLLKPEEIVTHYMQMCIRDSYKLEYCELYAMACK